MKIAQFFSWQFVAWLFQTLLIIAPLKFVYGQSLCRESRPLCFAVVSN